MTSAPAVAAKGDDEVESGALLAPSDHVHQAAPPPPQPSRLRFAHRCAARIVCAAIVFMVYVAALPLIGTLYYRAALMVGSGRWKAVPPCLPSEATTAIETQIAAACQRLNRAGAEYWLDRETLVAVTNEPNQRVFKHSSNADIAYMRRDHAKVVGALKSHDSLGEYYRYAHFDRGFLGHFDTKWKYAVGKGVAGQAWKFAIGLHSAAELSEKSERTENGRFALAVGDGESESLHIPWNVFPLRKVSLKKSESIPTTPSQITVSVAFPSPCGSSEVRENLRTAAFQTFHFNTARSAVCHDSIGRASSNPSSPSTTRWIMMFNHAAPQQNTNMMRSSARMPQSARRMRSRAVAIRLQHLTSMVKVL